MLGPKLDVIAAVQRRPGTVVYSQYVAGMVDRLAEAISSVASGVGRFTGEDKRWAPSSPLDGRIDVLVRIPADLRRRRWPPESVGQARGGLSTLDRCCLGTARRPARGLQASTFEEVEVVVPEVVLPGRARDGSDWSWDRRRMDRIKYKMTLADASLDGVQALGDLGPPEQFEPPPPGALDLWTQRIEAEGPFVFEREKLVIPLSTEAAAVALRRYGELSVLHARFNRKLCGGDPHPIPDRA